MKAAVRELHSGFFVDENLFTADVGILFLSLSNGFSGSIVLECGGVLSYTSQCKDGPKI